MALRVSPLEVQALIGSVVDPAHLYSFVADASLWIDNFLVGQSCTDADKLATIEKYLAAHLYQLSVEATSGGQMIASTRRGVSERYAERTGNDVGVTPFLRMAASFDMCGIIAGHFLGRERLQWRVGTGYRPETGAP